MENRRRNDVVLTIDPNELDDFIQHGILQRMVEYDPKLDFICTPIVIHDQVVKPIRRQIYALIWKSIRSITISRCIKNEQSYAFIELLQIPKTWSRYDIDLLLLKIGKKNFLNGLALRDEFVRILKFILTRDNNNLKRKYPYALKDLDFTRTTIQLTFSSWKEPGTTFLISFLLLAEFDRPCTIYFPETYTSLCFHNDLNEYLKHNPDIQLKRLTPYNSIKFRFDYQLTEAKFCEYLLQHPSRLSGMLSNYLKLRRQWLKYVHRAAKYSNEPIRTPIPSDQYRLSVCSVHSLLSTTSQTSESAQNTVLLAKEIEKAFESIFSIPLLRLLFFTICSKYQQLGLAHDNDTKYAVEKGLQFLSQALENNYLEHPFSRNINLFSDILQSYDINVRNGMKRLVKEMQQDWKR